MKNNLYFFCAFFIIGCIDKTRYDSELVVRNLSEYDIEVLVYPKNTNGNTWTNPSGQGGYISPVANLQKGQEFSFFHGADADDLPQDIITKYFYKIEYKRIKKDSSFISVSPVAATKNIFTEKSFWTHEKREHPRPTMFKNNLVVSNTYIFDIKE